MKPGITKDEAELEKTKAETSKLRAEVPLAIANLILTIVVGVGVAVFLNNRTAQSQKELVSLQAQYNEQTQKDIVDLQARYDEQTQKAGIDLQAESERQAKLAHLLVTTACSYSGCPHWFVIKNTGPANAENITAVISLRYIDPLWSSTIRDIRQFPIEKWPSTRDVQLRNKTVDQPFLSRPPGGGNAVEATLPNLPPGGSFTLIVDPPTAITTTTYTVTRPVTVHFGVGDALDAYSFTEGLGGYLGRRLDMAGFDLIATCDNCEGDETTSSLRFSSITHSGWETVEYTQSDSGSLWRLMLTVAYSWPQDVPFSPVSIPSDLDAAMTDSGPYVDAYLEQKP